MGARCELAGAPTERGAKEVVGHGPGERLLGDGEGVLMAERARGVARLHEGAGALRFAAPGKALGETRGGAVVMQRVRERVQRDGAVARAHCVVDRATDVRGLGEVVGEELRLLHRDLRHHALDDLTDTAVEILAIPRRDGVIDQFAQ